MNWQIKIYGGKNKKYNLLYIYTKCDIIFRSYYKNRVKMVNDTIITTRSLEQIKLDLGLETLTLLEDPKTVEIMLNPDGSLWVEQLGAKMRSYGNMNRACAISLMQTIASYHGTIINTENPILECEFPLDNSRFAGQFPPVVANPTFTIRKKAI